MATYRKATKKTPGRPPGGSDVEQQAERLARSLGESAQQVWLAGLGALGRAQAEGTRLFETLVEEGEQVERQARKSAGNRAGDVIQAVGASVDGVRSKAGDTWDKWEKAFDERLQRALGRLGVPRRDDLAELNRRVEELTAELRRQRAPARPRKAAAKRATAAPARSAAQDSAAPPPGPADAPPPVPPKPTGPVD